ncbi:MAG: hypothetical protein IJW82_00910 [Clostridia bacterium]|nr:hypothetical protein [Clostridia bacterium]
MKNRRKFMYLLTKIGIALIILGILGTILTYVTHTEERFGNVWGKFVGFGVFMLFMGPVIGL